MALDGSAYDVLRPDQPSVPNSPFSSPPPPPPLVNNFEFDTFSSSIPSITSCNFHLELLTTSACTLCCFGLYRYVFTCRFTQTAFSLNTGSDLLSHTRKRRINDPNLPHLPGRRTFQSCRCADKHRTHHTSFKPC
jgi:hypothetical protein